METAPKVVDGPPKGDSKVLAQCAYERASSVMKYSCYIQVMGSVLWMTYETTDDVCWLYSQTLMPLVFTASRCHMKQYLPILNVNERTIAVP